MTGAREGERDLLAAAVRMQRWVRYRSTAFGEHSELFRDPAWDMLIEAFVADCTGRPVHVKTLTCAANIPASTALRWVREIEKAGLVIRARSKDDRRASVIALTRQGRLCVASFLRRCEEVDLDDCVDGGNPTTPQDAQGI